MRLPARVRRLLIQALREEDPQRAIELFLAARLMLIVQTRGGGRELIKKIEEKLDALDGRLEEAARALRGLIGSIGSDAAEERV